MTFLSCITLKSFASLNCTFLRYITLKSFASLNCTFLRGITLKSFASLNWYFLTNPSIRPLMLSAVSRKVLYLPLHDQTKINTKSQDWMNIREQHLSSLVALRKNKNVYLWNKNPILFRQRKKRSISNHMPLRMHQNKQAIRFFFN